MNHYLLETPQQWKSGEIGGVDLFFDCAGCGADEPLIALFVANSLAWSDMGIVKSEKTGTFSPCMFCSVCAKRLLGGDSIAQLRKEHNL